MLLEEGLSLRRAATQAAQSLPATPRKPYLPHELLLAHSDSLSLHLDPLEPQFLLLLLLTGERIGQTHEPRRWVLGRVVLWAQGAGCHLLLVLVIDHCRRQEHPRDE